MKNNLATLIVCVLAVVLVIGGACYLECLAVAWAWNSFLVVIFPALPMITKLQAFIIIFVFNALFGGTKVVQERK